MADLERRAKAFAAKEKKRGVVYLSRVPPYMKPAKVKHLRGRRVLQPVWMKLFQPPH